MAPHVLPSGEGGRDSFTLVSTLKNVRQPAENRALTFTGPLGCVHQDPACQTHEWQRLEPDASRTSQGGKGGWPTSFGVWAGGPCPLDMGD